MNKNRRRLKEVIVKKISYIYHRVFFSLFLLLLSSYSQAQEFTASLQWSQRVELGFAVSGIIEKVFVNVGKKVKKGDALVQLDNDVFQANVNETKALFASAKEALNEAKRERDRALELYDRTVLSDHDLQVAKNNLTLARAEFEKVRARLIASQHELKYSTIRAPFDAVVLHRYAQPGQVIATQFRQDPLIVVAASNKMIAKFFVGEGKLSAIVKNKAVKIVVAGQSYAGKIIAIGLELVTANSSLSGSQNGYPVEVEFSVEKLLRAGRTAKVELE